MKSDIENRDDLLKLVTSFYDKLLSDPSISYLFTEVAKIDLEHHLDILVDFWDMIIFHSDTYQKNAMQPHLIVNSQSPINDEHFKTWLNYFYTTLDELFEGENTELAKQRAKSIATVMQLKISQQKN